MYLVYEGKLKFSNEFNGEGREITLVEHMSYTLKIH